MSRDQFPLYFAPWGISKKVPFLQHLFAKPRNLCRCVFPKRQHRFLSWIPDSKRGHNILAMLCVCSLQKQSKSQALKLYHGLVVNWIIFSFAPWPWSFSAKCRGSLHKGESPNVVGTPTTCGGRQRIDMDWWEVTPKKTLKNNIKKHLCRSIYKASKNRMYMSWSLQPVGLYNTVFWLIVLEVYNP